MRGEPRRRAGALKPGEKPITELKRSPFVSPSESAYDAPSEKPAIATFLGWIAQRKNASASMRSMNPTSGP